MKIIKVLDQTRTGRSITPQASDHVYVFDVAGDTNNNPNTFFVSVKLHYNGSDSDIAVAYLSSGDLLELDTKLGRITKIDSYFNCSFRVVR